MSIAAAAAAAAANRASGSSGSAAGGAGAAGAGRDAAAAMAYTEDSTLAVNLATHISRLQLQLRDAEEMRDELDEDEYRETKDATLRQLRELEEAQSALLSGSVSVVDEFGTNRLAMQQAIKNAFKTPEVIKLFAQRQPAALRQTFEQLKRDLTLGKIAEEAFKQQGIEIMLALKNLGEKLSDAEKAFLDSSSEIMERFETADKTIGENIVNVAHSGVMRAAQS